MNAVSANGDASSGDASHERPTYVYLAYDATDTLLYVGISHAPLIRMHQHAQGKTWFSQIITIKIEHYPNRREAEEREQTLVRLLQPPHNRDFTIRRRVNRDLPPGFRCRVTHCLRGHEFTPENTYVSPQGQRMCRLCRGVRNRRT